MAPDPFKQPTRDVEEEEQSSSNSEAESGSDSESVDEAPKNKKAAGSVIASTPVPKAASNSSSSEEEESSESDSEKQAPKSKKASGAVVASIPVPKAASNSSSSEEEESSESDSEKQAPKNKKAAGSVVASTPVPKSALKRSLSGAGTSTVQKRAKTGEEQSGVKKPPCCQRTWPKEDEIILLKGMIGFYSTKGKSPFDNKIDFFESFKEPFWVHPTQRQFNEKVRGLKDKYVKKIKKQNKGVKPKFANDHDKECMRLALLVWGPNAFADKSTDVKSAAKSKKKKAEEAEEEALADSDWIKDSSILQFMVSRGLAEGFVKQEWSSATMEEKEKLRGMYRMLLKQKMESEIKFMQEFTATIFKST